MCTYMPTIKQLLATPWLPFLNTLLCWAKKQSLWAISTGKGMFGRPPPRWRRGNGILAMNKSAETRLALAPIATQMVNTQGWSLTTRFQLPELLFPEECSL